MSIEDWIDPYGPPEDEGEPVTCNRCGEDELFWEQTPEGKWRLVDFDNVPHVCGRIEHWEDA